jgi:hypothetical protein
LTYCGNKVISAAPYEYLSLCGEVTAEVANVHNFLDPDELNLQIRTIDSLTAALNKTNKLIISKKQSLAKLRYSNASSKKIYNAEMRLIELESSALQRQYEIDMLIEVVLNNLRKRTEAH